MLRYAIKDSDPPICCFIFTHLNAATVSATTVSMHFIVSKQSLNQDCYYIIDAIIM